MFKSKIHLLIAVVLLVFFLQACSSNGDEQELSQPVLGLNITSTSTTLGDSSSEDLDSQTEEEISSTLSKILIKGTTQSDLFSDEVLEKAKIDFKDNSQASSNKVDVSIHELKASEDESILVVADIDHEIVIEGISSTRNGKIYFDGEGTIIGFDLTPFEPKESVPAS